MTQEHGWVRKLWFGDVKFLLLGSSLLRTEGGDATSLSPLGLWAASLRGPVLRDKSSWEKRQSHQNRLTLNLSGCLLQTQRVPHGAEEESRPSDPRRGCELVHRLRHHPGGVGGRVFNKCREMVDCLLCHFFFH